MSVLFNLSASQHSENTVLEEGVDYVVFENQLTGEKQRLLNLEHIKFAPKEGIIELKPIKTSNRHTNSVGFRVINDKIRGVQIGIPSTIDPKTGTIVWEKITIENYETFDLSIPKERARWICIKNSFYYTDEVNGVEQNHNFRWDTKAQYKAIDKEREADIFAKGLRHKRKAEDIAENLEGEQLMETALSLGIITQGMSEKRIWMEVVKFAQNKHEEFMKVFNSDTKAELVVYKRGLQTGILAEEKHKGVHYNGLTLGFNEFEVITYLKEHPSTFASIDALSRKINKDTDVSMVNPEKIVTEKNAREIALEKELESYKVRLAAVNDVAIQNQSENDLADIHPEFASKLAEAKQLDVKGAHKIKSYEKLCEAVEAKKKLKEN